MCFERLPICLLQYTLDLKFNGKCDSDTACQDDPCLEGVVMQWSLQNDTANYIIISHYAVSPF